MAGQHEVIATTDQLTEDFVHLTIQELQMQDIGPGATAKQQATYIGSRRDTSSLSLIVRHDAQIDYRFSARDDNTWQPLSAGLSWLFASHGLGTMTATRMQSLSELCDKDDVLTWKIADILREQTPLNIDHAIVTAKVMLEAIVHHLAPDCTVRLGLVCFDPQQGAYLIESHPCGQGQSMGTIWMSVEDRDSRHGALWSPIVPFGHGNEYLDCGLLEDMKLLNIKCGRE